MKVTKNAIMLLPVLLLPVLTTCDETDYGPEDLTCADAVEQKVFITDDQGEAFKDFTYGQGFTYQYRHTTETCENVCATSTMKIEFDCIVKKSALIFPQLYIDDELYTLNNKPLRSKNEEVSATFGDIYYDVGEADLNDRKTVKVQLKFQYLPVDQFQSDLKYLAENVKFTLIITYDQLSN